MPKSGSHPDRALTAVGVRNLKSPGRYADGGGLYLVVSKTGAKKWILRCVIRGARTDLGLGSLRTVSLADAREQAGALLKIARSGGDPREERRKQKATLPTFEEAARKVHSAREPTWRNPKHAAQWISSLERYVFPEIGGRRVNQIETGDILKVLGPIWLTKPETARRVRQRIATVLDWARAAGHRDGENPVAGVGRGLPKQPERVGKHHAAMPYDQVPAFVQSRLPELPVSRSVCLALEFLILTAGRTGEVLGAYWSEFDLDNALWVVPGARMKTGRDHRSPLSDRACAVLNAVADLSGGEGYVFPGAKTGRPLSNMALLMAHRRAEIDVTPHGYRSSFRDWAAERSNARHEVIEAALAHTVDDKVVAAYMRTDFFEQRRQLMQAWADYVCQPKGEVVPIAGAR